MAIDPTVASTLASMAQQQILEAKVAKLQGQLAAHGSLAVAITSASEDVQKLLSAAMSELNSLATGSPLTDDFGQYSTLEQAMQAERYAGKAATVDFVKANPACTEEDATAAYRTAALAARPADRQWLLIDPASLRQEYSAELVKLGLIPDTSWASWAAWIVATDKDTILGLS